MAQRDDLVLVTGATGAQGGATARALLAAAFPVRVLSRNPGGDAAQALAQLGAEVVQGDYEDVPSIESACRDTAAVFSVQRPDTDGSDAERRHGFALIDAARKAGTRHFVHTSVCEAGKHESFPRWESGYWYQKYWTDKWDIEERVRAAGFERWTVLKPAFMMDNYAEPKAERMFPQLRHGEILTAFPPDTRLQLIAADDVGAFARAALMEPARFDRHDIDLAAEALTMTEAAAILSRHCGATVRARSATAKEVKAAGQFPGWVRTQEWIGEVGYRADIGALTQWGVALTSFDSWVQRHRSSIRIDDGSRN